jgi:S-adenosylmethionine hydrolase
MRWRKRGRIVTLLTDFGSADPYVGEVKGAVLSRCSDAVLVDITHEVAPYNVKQGAFLLKLSYKFFPAGTIHLAVVDPDVGTERRGVVIRTRRFWFVGPDNGLLYPAAVEDGLEECFEIEVNKYPRVGGDTFHARDVFGPVAGEIAIGARPSMRSVSPSSLNRLELSRARFVDGQAEAEVLHIDRFGNAILNVGAEGFPRNLRPGDEILVELEDASHLAVYSRSYAMLPSGTLLATLGGTGLLELAVSRGSASAVLGLRPGARLRLRII